MLPGLRETVEKHGLLASKALGQNFLLDRNITDKIIRLSLNRQGLSSFAGSNVCEIGPGPGGLTRAVLEAAPASLTVIEMDPRCIAIMEELKEQTNVPFRIVNGDALTFDLSREIEAPRQLVSNLPYNVSVPLFDRLAETGRQLPGNDAYVPKRSGGKDYRSHPLQRLRPALGAGAADLRRRKASGTAAGMLYPGAENPFDSFAVYSENRNSRCRNAGKSRKNHLARLRPAAQNAAPKLKSNARSA